MKLEEMCCLLSSHVRKVVVYKETILDVTKQAICLSNSSLFMLSRTYRIVKRSIGEKKRRILSFTFVKHCSILKLDTQISKVDVK